MHIHFVEYHGRSKANNRSFLPKVSQNKPEFNEDVHVVKLMWFPIKNRTLIYPATGVLRVNVCKTDRIYPCNQSVTIQIIVVCMLKII